MRPPDLAARVLHRDGLMIIIDKPAGIAVHANPGARKGEGPPSLEDYFDQLRFGLPRPPALAHRLDRDTTGCLVLGRHPKALRKLHKLFLEGRVEKVYWAIVAAPPEKPSGTIDAPLEKRNDPSGWRVVVDPAGKPSAPTWRTLASGGGLTLIEARPKTGRTHQIRVHLAHIGSPIFGDRLYGGPDGAMMLHARRIRVPIAATKPAVEATAPPPAAMRALLESRIGWRDAPDPAEQEL